MTARKSRAKRVCTTTLYDELCVAFAQGQTTGRPIRVLGDKLYLVEPTISWGDLAQTLSLNLPGQFWVGSNGVSWVNGAHTTWLAPEERLPGILEARAICHECTGLPEENVPCSASGAARKMLEWLGIVQVERRALDHIGATQHWQYQYCHPQDLPEGYLWDITSCYFTLLERAPSPKVGLLQGRLKWFPISKEERARWNTMLRLSAPHKGLRNSFVGQMYASGNGQFYTNGRSNFDPKLDGPPEVTGVVSIDSRLAAPWEVSDELAEQAKAHPGPLRPLASLIVRSAYELCALAQQEERAIYANTDCVITASGAIPKIWQKYGLRVSLKGQGPTEVNTIGYYRVGDYATKWFKKAEAKGNVRPRVPAGYSPAIAEQVRLILSGETWVDKWLQVSDTWTPEKEEERRILDRELISSGIKAVSELSRRQRKARIERQEEDQLQAQHDDW